MKIVEVCAFYAPQGGGIRTYIQRKLVAGPAAGHEVVVIVPGAEDKVEEIAPGSRLVTLASPPFPLDRRYRYFDDEPALHAALDAERPDVVEVSSQWRSCAMVADWPGDARRVLVMHSDPLSAYLYRWFGPIAGPEAIDAYFDLYWRYLRRLSRRFDAIVSASPRLSARLRAGGVEKVETVPMGVDPGIFSPRLRDEALRRELLARCSLGPDGLLLLAAGRLAPEKRWPMVVDAVAAAGYRQPVGLVLVGGGRHRARITRVVAGNPHAHLLAPVSDRAAMARLMASADALVHGCEAETFCIVAAEARASGLPLIVPDAGGAADQYRPGIDQIYAAAKPAALVEAILRWAETGRDRSAAEAALPVRTMDEHFVDLFRLYGQLGDAARQAA
ncbi:MAG: glycosyltransferase [Sphingomonadaceae bacterium]|nr:glycosyltransferase [Sphingomonadaceae bacterium]